MAKKFYNHVFMMKAGDDKVFAKVEGNLGKYEPTVETKKIGERDRKIAKVSIGVSNKVEAKFDYTLSNYDKTKSYSENVFVTVVGWDNMADVLLSRVEKAKELMAKDGNLLVTFDVLGQMKKVTYQGKNGEVSYLELTVPNEDAIKFNFITKKSGSGTQSSSGQANNIEGDGFYPEAPIDDEMPF